MEPYAIKLNSAALSARLHLPYAASQADATHQTRWINGDFIYHYYGCDGMDDVGWGCGYRTLQTLNSWLALYTKPRNAGGKISAFSIRNVQFALTACGDKQPSFFGSRQWIGCYESFLFLSKVYEDLDFRIHHSARGKFLHDDSFQILEKHFDLHGSPVMMGGDTDSMAKCILGTARTAGRCLLLVADPHYINRKRLRCKDELLNDVLQTGYLRWFDIIELIDVNSFYNILMPLTSSLSTTTGVSVRDATSSKLLTLKNSDEREKRMIVRKNVLPADENDDIIELDYA